VAALLAAVCEFTQIAMTSFNNFYFGPHKAFPYPYHDARAAHNALFRDCGMAALFAFVVVFILQRVFLPPHRT
jgi:hypothetical protein